MIISKNPLYPIDSTCLICFESDSQSYTFTCNCKGSFHNQCLQIWFSKNSYECPLCRVYITETCIIDIISEKNIQTNCLVYFIDFLQVILVILSLLIVIFIPAFILYSIIKDR